jgi:hypothetical protein
MYYEGCCDYDVTYVCACVRESKEGKRIVESKVKIKNEYSPCSVHSE